MSEPTEKRSLFGRLFGRSAEKPAAPPKEPPPSSQVPPQAPATDVPAPAPTPTVEEDASPAHTEAANAAGLPVAVEPASPPQPTASEPVAAKPSWLQRLRSGLSKTSSRLAEGITTVFTRRKLDEDTLQEFEDLLIQADLGVETAMRITEALAKGRYEKGLGPEDVKAVLAAEVAKVLQPVSKPLEFKPEAKPHVILVVGVNGSGKTTTIGKLAKLQQAEGRRVMLAAGDTFRAAAIDQLKVWGERTGAPVIARDVGADSSGLAYDALKAAQDGGYDLLLMDTAGRLQNKQALMDELEKVIRVIKKLDPTAPHDVLLVLDATTGQNALSQVEVFQ